MQCSLPQGKRLRTTRRSRGGAARAARRGGTCQQGRLLLLRGSRNRHVIRVFSGGGERVADLTWRYSIFHIQSWVVWVWATVENICRRRTKRASVSHASLGSVNEWGARFALRVMFHLAIGTLPLAKATARVRMTRKLRVLSRSRRQAGEVDRKAFESTDVNVVNRIFCRHLCTILPPSGRLHDEPHSRLIAREPMCRVRGCAGGRRLPKGGQNGGEAKTLLFTGPALWQVWTCPLGDKGRARGWNVTTISCHTPPPRATELALRRNIPPSAWPFPCAVGTGTMLQFAKPVHPSVTRNPKTGRVPRNCSARHVSTTSRPLLPLPRPHLAACA